MKITRSPGIKGLILVGFMTRQKNLTGSLTHIGWWRENVLARPSPSVSRSSREVIDLLLGLMPLCPFVPKTA